MHPDCVMNMSTQLDKSDDVEAATVQFACGGGVAEEISTHITLFTDHSHSSNHEFAARSLPGWTNFTSPIPKSRRNTATSLILLAPSIYTWSNEHCRKTTNGGLQRRYLMANHTRLRRWTGKCIVLTLKPSVHSRHASIASLPWQGAASDRHLANGTTGRDAAVVAGCEQDHAL